MLSKLLSQFSEVTELRGVKSSRTLSHCYAVSRNRVSHVEIVNQVR